MNIGGGGRHHQHLGASRQNANHRQRSAREEESHNRDVVTTAHQHYTHFNSPLKGTSLFHSRALTRERVNYIGSSALKDSPIGDLALADSLALFGTIGGQLLIMNFCNCMHIVVSSCVIMNWSMVSSIVVVIPCEATAVRTVNPFRSIK